MVFGIALALSSWIARPGSRGLADFASTLLIGIVGGLVICVPIAAALAIGERYPDWWGRNSFRIKWYTSLAMGFSLGYFVAWIRHEVLDYWGIAAMAVVGLGAVIKIAVAAAESKN